ncbi:endonuclease domain-containing protein [Stieleria neptunia]|nr:DUF559 domain-containing protein [Stieleria neptunia]
MRQNKTRSEGLLWSILRAKQVSGLKFRQQHRIDPYIVDFACVAPKLVVEIDGGYHEEKYEKDLERQRFLEDQGWHVIRFATEDVEKDPEAVARAIAASVKVPYEFRPRTGRGQRPRTKPR